MSGVERTDQRDALLHLGGSTGPGGMGGYIEEMEQAGQRQLVAARVLPAELSNCTDGDLTALGFVLGDVDAQDPLFRAATLPAGCRGHGRGRRSTGPRRDRARPGAPRATDHSLWTELVDEQQRIRAMVFYKATFYDRRAFLSLRGVDADQPSITCPVCGRTSYHPRDVEHGYCGACHQFTSTAGPAGGAR